MESPIASASPAGSTGRHISSSDARASTGTGPSAPGPRPRRKAKYFAMSVSGALSPPFEVVIPVSKSSPLATGRPSRTS
jgi:hypothetical protein